MRTPEEIMDGLKRCSGAGECKECPYYDGDELCMGALAEDALAYVQQLEAQQLRWISVRERMPEDMQRVYVRFGGRPRGAYIAQYFENHCKPQADFWVLENDWECHVHPTHWMPMPPKSEEE